MKRYSFFVLAGDVGGTHTNIGVSGVVDGNTTLIISFDFSSQELRSIIPAIDEVISYCRNRLGISVSRGCIAAAGPVSEKHDFCEMTKAGVSWNVDAREIVKKSRLRSVIIINDFEAIGYGINHLKKKDIISIGKGSEVFSRGTKALIGAGTGLGKSILVYDPHKEIYLPIPSEGGHGDFPAQDKFDIELIDFIRKERNIKDPAAYDELLSGRGIEGIYAFLGKKKVFKSTDYTKEIDGAEDKAALISKYRKKDRRCRETFKLFTKYYARCGKNIVLDALARGGLYIAGGIASKNRDIFKNKEFLTEFCRSDQRKKLLKKIPIYIITDYNISLHGAATAALKRQDIAIRISRSKKR